MHPTEDEWNTSVFAEMSNYVARSRSIRVTGQNFCWRRRSTPRLRVYAAVRDIPRWRHYGRKWQITCCLYRRLRQGSHGDVGCRCRNSASERVRFVYVRLPSRAIRFSIADDNNGIFRRTIRNYDHARYNFYTRFTFTTM